MVLERKATGMPRQGNATIAQLKPLLISFVIFMLLCGTILLFTFNYLGNESTKVTKESAANFELGLFDGGKFQLSEHKGEPILISFFASWCLPCIEEAPVINKAYDEYGPKGIKFLAVAVSDEETKARQFVNKYGLRFPAGLDSEGKIYSTYKITGIPTLIFIDKDGITNHVHSGGITERSLKHELDQIL